MTTTTSWTPEELRRELVKRLELQPLDTWPPRLLRFVLNAMDLEADGELEKLLHVPTSRYPTMTIQLDTTGIDFELADGTGSA